MRIKFNHLDNLSEDQMQSNYHIVQPFFFSIDISFLLAKNGFFFRYINYLSSTVDHDAKIETCDRNNIVIKLYHPT